MRAHPVRYPLRTNIKVATPTATGANIKKTASGLRGTPAKPKKMIA
jgi:hypothetical protein